MAEHSSCTTQSSASSLNHRRPGPAGSAVDGSLNVLQELPVDRFWNEAATNSCLDVALAANFQKLRIASPKKQAGCDTRAARQRRPLSQAENFEPLNSVEEETSSVTDDEVTIVINPPSDPQSQRRPSSLLQGQSDYPILQASIAFIVLLLTSASEGSSTDNHPLANAEFEQPIAQIEKHLAGQFEWLVSYAATARSDQHCSPQSDGSCIADNTVVFGCNLLSRRPQSTPGESSVRHPSRTIYTLIATPIKGNAHTLPHFEAPVATEERFERDTAQFQPGTDTMQMALRVRDAARRTPSPSPTLLNEFTAEVSKDGTYSNSRIEDSLEELDKLEEDLEAVNVVTRPARLESKNKDASHGAPTQQSSAIKANTSKRVSIVEPFPTVRVQPPEKTNTTLRRSTSLTLRDKTGEACREIAEHQKPAGFLTRSKSTSLRTAAQAPAVRSTKPPTVPNFELPGEAVARRLREQREARQAQQAEAQKNHATPTKSRVGKPLPRPTFELPGEAISRRKREEHESRLRAQEEEERKRREFKARPVRHTIGPSTLPRETIASLARQGKLPQQEEAGRQPKRASVAGLKSLLSRSTAGESTLSRGRNSIVVPTDNTSRATSTSTGSTSGQRSTVSAEDAEKQRIRGRAIFARDNSYTQQRERERTEREIAAKKARDEAAERSRIASREWAEKRRRR